MSSFQWFKPKICIFAHFSQKRHLNSVLIGKVCDCCKVEALDIRALNLSKTRQNRVLFFKKRENNQCIEIEIREIAFLLLFLLFSRQFLVSAGNGLSLNLHSLIASMWQPSSCTLTFGLNSFLNFDKFRSVIPAFRNE